MSNLPPNPYDRTVIIEPRLDNPDRAPLAGTGRDFVVSLREQSVPGSALQFLNANGQWVQFTTSEFAAWGGIIGTLSDQTDLWTVLQQKADLTALANVAFSGSYADLSNKPVFGDVAFINTTGNTATFLRADGTWAVPADVSAAWGSITGDLNNQTDLAAALAALAPLVSPIFTGTPMVPTPPQDDASEKIANTLWFFDQAFNGLPVMDGAPASGDSLRWARGNHRHPSDTTRAPIDSPSFTGIPLSTTPGALDNSTRIATTAMVQAAIAAAGLTPPPSDGQLYGMRDGAWEVINTSTRWDKT